MSTIPRRVAMVGPFGFHPNKTMRSRALPLARALVRRGHAVKLIMPPWQTPDEADRSWQEDGVSIRYVALSGGVAGIARRLVAEVLAWEPEVVHAFKPKAYSGMVAWWLWQFHRRRLRLVTDADDWESWGGWNERAPYTPLQKHFFAWQEEWGLRHCHALTVASRALQTLAWAEGVPPERVHYVPNGPGIGDAGDGRAKREELGLIGRPVLLLYSRLFEFEAARLVAILAQVRAAVPELAVLAVGAGLYEEDAAELRRELAEAGLLEAFVDVGWVAEEEVPALLAAADVGIYLIEDNLLNRAKCPVKLADMLSVGLPVVGEAVGQVPEYVVHNRTGRLRPCGDNAGIAADLIELLCDPAERARLGQAARGHIRAKFSWDVLAERVVGVYEAYQSTSG